MYQHNEPRRLVASCSLLGAEDRPRIVTRVMGTRSVKELSRGSRRDLVQDKPRTGGLRVRGPFQVHLII